MITRFAPSPTGELHLGHVAHAIWVWRIAAQQNAKVIVRMEDHDRTRCKPEYERSILDDLEWLGFVPDAVSRASLDAHPSEYRQSDHPERYEEAFRKLQQVTDVYGCTCTRAMLETSGPDGERRYPGTCRGMPIDRDGRHAVRARIPGGETEIQDLLLGPLLQQPQHDQGDVAIRDVFGQWTYQFCVAVDDMHDGVNLIVRGEDLAPSTGRQWLLAKLLGRTEPIITAHHPLIYAADGRKLSKRDRSETVRAMRERGMHPADVIAAAGAGREGSAAPRMSP
ncbi:MAG: glutamate--tRNA ligase family protein [Gemmatimonadota bacterium]